MLGFLELRSILIDTMLSHHVLQRGQQREQRGPAGRQRLERALEERRGTEEGEEFKPIWRGWCLGEEKFRAKGSVLDIVYYSPSFLRRYKRWFR